MSINIKIENNLENPNHPEIGDYHYSIRIKGDLVLDGIVENYSRSKHPIMLIEAMLDDAKARLHEGRMHSGI